MGEDGVTPLPLSPGRGAHTNCCSESPHRKVNSLPSCVPGFPQIPTLNLSVPGPLAYPASQFSCVLSRAHSWDSKFQILKDRQGLDPLPFSRGQPHSTVSGAVLFQKSSRKATQVPGVYDEAQRKAATNLSALCVCFCPLLLNGHSVAPSGSFVLEEAIYSLPNVLQEGERSLSAWPKGSLHHAVPCLLLGLCPPFPQKNHCLPGLIPANGMDF